MQQTQSINHRKNSLVGEAHFANGGFSEINQNKIPVKNMNEKQKSDSFMVRFRVKTHLLEKWNAFIEENSIPSRTAFIINACNHYMLNFNLSTKKEMELASMRDEYKGLQEQMSELIGKMEDKISSDEIKKQDPRIKAQIINYLKRHEKATSDEMYGIVGLEHEILIDILTGMKKDKILGNNKEQEWYIVDGEQK